MTSHPAVLATAFHTNHIRDRGIPISFVNTPQRVPQGERQAYTTRTTISPSVHLPPPLVELGGGLKALGGPAGLRRP